MLGLTCCTPTLVATADLDHHPPSAPSPWPGADQVVIFPRVPGPRTAMDRPVDADGLPTCSADCATCHDGDCSPAKAAQAAPICICQITPAPHNPVNDSTGRRARLAVNPLGSAHQIGVQPASGAEQLKAQQPSVQVIVQYCRVVLGRYLSDSLSWGDPVDEVDVRHICRGVVFDPHRWPSLPSACLGRQTPASSKGY